MTDAKQYGLKVIHKPSNMVRSEKWFDTTKERTAAMSGSTLEPHYIYVLMERDAAPATDSAGEKA
jgi:hypothetical protein